LNSFSLFIGLGASLGLAWVAWQARQVEQASQAQIEQRMAAGIAALAGALAGSRAGFVWLNWEYFQAHPLEIAQIWLGGLTGTGALLGALAALGLYAVLRRAPFGRLADSLLPLALVVVVSAWLACWQAGCAYGAPVPAASWFGIPMRDEWGEVAFRWPVQLVGALASLGSFWLIERLRPHLRRPGRAAGLGFLALSLQLFILTFVRADAAPVWRSQRLDTWIWLGVLVLATLATLAAFLPGSRGELVETIKPPRAKAQRDKT